MCMRNWLKVGLLGLALIGGPGACGGSGDPGDGGPGDGGDGADVDPCEAAAPEWNAIWQIELADTGLEGITPDTNLMDVWGAGPDDIFAVGFAGTVLHYDGSGWTRMQSGSEADLEGVWGYALEDAEGNRTRIDVFAAGSDGTILRYNGTNWTPMLVVNDPDPPNTSAEPVAGTFHDIWGIRAGGTGPDDHPVVVAVGGDGLIAELDGENNRFVEMRDREVFTDSDGNERVSWVRYSPERLGGVFGAGSRNDPLFVAVGNNGLILELAGGAWSRNRSFTPGGNFVAHLNGVWGRGAWEIFATGIDGTVIRRDNGGTWHVLAKENDLWDLAPVFLRGTWSFHQSLCGEYPEVPDGGEPPEDPVREDTSWVIFIGWNGTLLMGHDGLICDMQVPTGARLEGIWGQPPRPEDQRRVDGGTADGGVECDPIEVVVTGVNGTLLRLSNPEGR